ncbi:protein NRT1/ PTR FAMILY 5.5-like [Rhododendron vialii]|uniref:protein NRT1/ PTR FAMILY 5.5-like n=1 Tax=Rhododendron vialii TaxID=182163 RepID=UPI00265EF734|nr:protein NRT1/ PTR FAMILY 5.5-like [Rhododendron vialii]
MPTDTSFLKIRRKFDQIFIKLFYIKIWKNYYFCLCWGAAVTTGLAYTQWFVGYAVVGVLITYFTDTWKEHNLPNAVAMINLLEGSSSVLALVMTYISDNHVRPLKVILCSTAAYIIGMVMLCISAFHPIAGDMTGMYFVPVVLLIAVGKAGGVPVLEGFLVGQLRAHEPRQLLDIDEGRVNARKNVWWITASLLCGLSTPWIFGHVHAGWLVTFVCSTSVMGIGYLLFLCCIALYHRSVKKAAATSEISRASPKENANNGPTPAVSAGRRVPMEQWKPLSVMIPMWTTFLVFGLVLSTGNTFFTEQGNNMHATVSIYRLIMIRNIIKATLSSSFYTLLFKYIPKPLKTKSIIVGILTAMVVSVFCCSVAWRVEVRRLRAIEDSKFCVKFNQDDRAVVPMSILRLAPQFCLLGLMEGIGKQGLDLFFEVQVPHDVPMEKYGSALNEAVIGFGSFINALLVYGLKGWFGDTLNCSSRLDNYYQMMMILSFVNLCYNWFVSTLYWDKKETRDDVKGNQEMVIELLVE